jgi:hypothetical protein
MPGGATPLATPRKPACGRGGGVDRLQHRLLRADRLDDGMRATATALIAAPSGEEELLQCKDLIPSFDCGAGMATARRRG